MNISNVTASLQSTLVNIAQEAMETTAQTKLEAAKGDRQALMKAAKLDVQQAAPQTPPVAPAGTGEVLNVQR